MDKKEFRQWVKKAYGDFQKDKQAIAYSDCSDILNGKTKMQKAFVGLADEVHKWTEQK